MTCRKSLVTAVSEAGNVVNVLYTSVSTELGNGAQSKEITFSSYSPQLSQF